MGMGKNKNSVKSVKKHKKVVLTAQEKVSIASMLIGLNSGKKGRKVVPDVEAYRLAHDRLVKHMKREQLLGA